MEKLNFDFPTFYGFVGRVDAFAPSDIRTQHVSPCPPNLLSVYKCNRHRVRISYTKSVQSNCVVVDLFIQGLFIFFFLIHKCKISLKGQISSQMYLFLSANSVFDLSTANNEVYLYFLSINLPGTDKCVFIQYK